MEGITIHNQQEKEINSIGAMHLFASDFSQSLCGGQVICLEGDLGAGKTTFTQGLLAALGAQGPYVSPTFLIMKCYELDVVFRGHTQNINRVYHIDAYRITSADMIELGWEEILCDQEALVIVEWPQRISDILPQLPRQRNLFLEHGDEEGKRIVRY